MSRLDRDTDLSPLAPFTAGSVYVTEKRLVLQSFRINVLWYLALCCLLRVQ